MEDYSKKNPFVTELVLISRVWARCIIIGHIFICFLQLGAGILARGAEDASRGGRGG